MGLCSWVWFRGVPQVRFFTWVLGSPPCDLRDLRVIFCFFLNSFTLILLPLSPGAPGSFFYLGLGFSSLRPPRPLRDLLLFLKLFHSYTSSSLAGCPRFVFLPGSWVFFSATSSTSA